MKMKTLAIATIMTLGVASTVNAADVNSGKVTFTGTVLDTPCDLKAGQNGSDINVNFNQLSKSQLNANNTATERFTILLSNCDLTSKATSIRFTSPSQDTSNAFINTQINNLGIKLELANGLGPIVLGTAKVLTGLNTKGDNELTFNAIAYKTSSGTETKDLVTEGNFEAISNFVISYQ
ncbi:fimbrial protein [Providencia sp. Me31A]|uniref:fimbrial protein n=1 Tax=Providencia sp. Me31A TaxID=3392637 RepID=UPI003D28394D